MENPLAAHCGTYHGLSPTDESAIAMGEAKIVITDDSLVLTHATGCEIRTDALPTDRFVPMTPEEVLALYKEGSVVVKGVVGFKGKEHGYPILLFFNESRSKQGMLMWTGGMGDILGPTMMSGPSLLSRLGFGIGTWLLDFRTKGGFPRFRYNGKTRRYA